LGVKINAPYSFSAYESTIVLVIKLLFE